MTHVTRPVTALVSLVLMLGTVMLVQTAPAQAGGRYTPAVGVKFNNPIGSSEREIFRHLVRSVRSTPGSHEIRIASWNLKSETIVDALLAAHRRGVSVQVIVARGNANPENPNISYNRLKNNLNGDKSRPKSRRSWARTCTSSCRGGTGIAHTKMFLFSRVGQARDVVMFGSANATEIAASHQWNDLFTLREKGGLYQRSEDIFREMAADRRVGQPYRVFKTGKYRAIWYPYATQKTTGDPTLRELRRVECQGARGGTGNNGRTVLRIAMTAWLGDSGMEIARRVKTMWNRGCDVKVVYAVIGNQILQILRDSQGRGAVPLRQIVQDFNGDGIYDRYLHMKVLTVSGVWRGDRSATVTWNGSANWTPVSLRSDEMGMRILSPATRRNYANWVNRLFANPPPNPSGRFAARGVAPDGTKVDPYAKIQFN